MRNLGGTCSSVEMLKGCMFRERLGTPDVDNEEEWRQHTSLSESNALWTVAI